MVVGMHRSGTSLTARMLAAGGWHPGTDLLASEHEEYYEDAAFVALHRTWTTEDLRGSSSQPDVDSHPDWGVVDARVPPGLGRSRVHLGKRVEAAQAYAAERSRVHGNWVAKDPRVSLHLDVWAQVEDLRFLVVYRNPWDVVDSAVRLGADVFCRRPRVAREAWLGYHLRILRFIREHRDRVMVVGADAVVGADTGVWDALDRWIGMTADRPAALVDPQRFVLRNDSHAIAAIYRDVYPVHTAVLAALDKVADVPRAAPEQRRRKSLVVAGGSLAEGSGIQVIMPCRDDGDFLAEAVASVEQSARATVELTIIDDGSSDPETLRVLDALRASGRQVLRTEGVGLAAARNVACTVSRTGIVLPLDADNRVRVETFSAAHLMIDLDVDIVHGAWSRFGMDTRVVRPPNLALDTLIPHNQIDACALVRRSLLERLGGWDEVLPFWEDWDLWLRSACSGARTHRVDDVLFDYLVRPGSLSERSSTDVPAVAAAIERMMSKDLRIRVRFEAGQLSIDGQPS